MAHYLTWNSGTYIYSVLVNGTSVSSGYELQDGDTIVVNVQTSTVANYVVTVNGNTYTSGSTISLSDTDIALAVTYNGGSIN